MTFPPNPASEYPTDFVSRIKTKYKISSHKVTADAVKKFKNDKDVEATGSFRAIHISTKKQKVKECYLKEVNKAEIEKVTGASLTKKDTHTFWGEKGVEVWGQMLSGSSSDGFHFKKDSGCPLGMLWGDALFISRKLGGVKAGLNDVKSSIVWGDENQ